MQTVSICFSGHPRTMLAYRSQWQAYFDKIRSRYQLRIFFHSWSGGGLVRQEGARFVEGEYLNNRYNQFDDLLGFLQPAAFRIEEPLTAYEDELSDMGEVLASSVQAHPSAIMSQIHSVYLANEIRRSYEKRHGGSDVVVKLRFDLLPAAVTLNEIDYVAQYPEHEVLFAPSPRWHGHPGGGGGCNTCHAFFDRYWRDVTYLEEAQRFVTSHEVHNNDICDLFSIAAPSVMNHYCDMFVEAGRLYKELRAIFSECDEDYTLQPIAGMQNIKRIVSTRSGQYDIERSAIFVPEKLIRINMRRVVVVHGESVFHIVRR